MGNCLVTKLKGSVNNNTLLKYGEMKLVLKNSNNNALAVGSVYYKGALGNLITLRIIDGDGYFVDSNGVSIGNTFTPSSDSSNRVIRYKSSTDLVVAFTGKYDDNILGLSPFEYVDISADELMYCHISEIVGNISRTKISGNLGNLHISKRLICKYIGDCGAEDIEALLSGFSDADSILTVATYSTGKQFDSSIINNVDKTTLNKIDFTRGDLFKNSIEPLGFFKITNLYTPVSMASAYTGTLEGFVTNLLTHNPSGGKFKFAFPQDYKNVTYNGESLATHPSVLKQEQSYINYDAQGNITWTAS